MAPALKVEVKLNVCPVQRGVFAPAVGAEGVGLTVIESVPTGPEQPPAVVAKTEYVPPPANVMAAIVGF